MNNGYFDVRAMLTFGVSAKTSDTAIGYFGTGFKYAVAIILRLGGSIKVTSAGEETIFEARKETIRDQEFNIVYVNGREAGFTTRLGINWQPWMAFRELYCNASDEHGVTSDQKSEYETVVEVNCKEIADAFRSKSDYFLSGNPSHTGSQAEIYDCKKPFIFYKGVAVKQADPNAIFTYNITSNIDLTEDRTCKSDYQLMWPIRKAMQSLTNHAMLRKIVRSGDHWEAKIGFDADWETSDDFFLVCNELMATDIGVCESARLLAKTKEAKKGEWPEFYLSKVQMMQLQKAISFLSKIDVDINRFPIKCVTGLGEGVMGRALNGVIYLSEIPFNMGTKQVASTLLEEWVHNKTGAADFDRVMQSWLFDKILSLGENINGEPI